MKLLLDENLSRRLVPFLVHGHPPSVIWLKTENPSKAVTLKVLLDYREHIVQALQFGGLGIVELRA